MGKKNAPAIMFKWYYCLLVGFASIIDGIVIVLTIGWYCTDFSLKLSMYGARKNIYRTP